jgi:hypothetical protein
LKTYENYLDEYIELVIKLADYDKASNIVNDENYNYKVSLKIGKKINSLAKKLINIDIEKFIKLLDHDNILVRENSAEYLYPLYPNKCINIMIEYSNNIEKELDKIKINSKLQGLKRKDPFFENLYKELYNVNDLASLNKE